MGNCDDASLCRIAANESVGVLADRVLEGGHSALRVRKTQREGEQKTQTEGFDSHGRILDLKVDSSKPV
jgi:hypothetical protein